MISIENTIRAYSGKPGCMCGCKGNYNESIRARKMALTALLKNPDVKFEVFGDVGDGAAGCLFYCNDTRNRVLYLNSKGVEEAYAMGLVSVEHN